MAWFVPLSSFEQDWLQLSVPTPYPVQPCLGLRVKKPYIQNPTSLWVCRIKGVTNWAPYLL